MSYQERILGNMQVACSYYYAIILATRPYLVYHSLQKHAGTKAPPSAEAEDGMTSVEAAYADVAMLAKSCEDAAVFMASACHEVLEEDLLLDNMCLIQYVKFKRSITMYPFSLTYLRAFLFASALILGLVMFTDNDSDKDVGRALKNAVEVMQRLSRRSRQAEHYLWILRDMQRDIDEAQERTDTQRRESSHRPVRKILQLTRGVGHCTRILACRVIQDRHCH